MLMAVRASMEVEPALLRQTKLGNFLSDPQLNELERFARWALRRAGTTLFRQGEPAVAVYLLVEGSVELRARPPGRRVYRTVEVVQAGCCVGHEVLFGEEAYLVSARVLDQARLLSLSRPSFQRLAEQRPDIAMGVLRCSGSCLLRTIRRAAILTQSPAGVGLRHLLAELSGRDGQNGGEGGSVSLRITHAQLAGVLHLSRETVSRMLSQMAEAGEVELGRGVIRVRTMGNNAQ